MTAADLDRLFAAIRRTRDPELLSTLFERTAPWLLQRARRLIGQASLAEDVVQDLFLGLLKNGHGCEPGRPCLPYLLGMLHRRAAHVRRQRVRTLAQGLRDAVAAHSAPVDAAMTTEARAAVRSAIDALPVPYREVMRRFVAHQSPAAIGQALGRTPNAVRVQLHRGLRLLRSTLPPGLVLLLCTVLARPAPAQVVRRRSTQLAAGTLAAGALVTLLCASADQAGASAAHDVASVRPVLTAAETAGGLDGTPVPSARTEVRTAALGELVLELRHADGSPAASVGVLAHPAGRDPDFGATTAVSGADGVVPLSGLPAGCAAVVIDRGLELGCTVAPGTSARQIVVLPEGLDVAGIVRDAMGRPVPDAGIWLCAELRSPSEGRVVARAGADGRFVLRSVPSLAALAAVREGSVPSVLHRVGPSGGEVELVLGGAGARLTGRVLGRNGAAVAGAVVRIARHPRANFLLPSVGDLGPVHPCAVVRTDAAGEFALADLPPGPMQVLVRATHHRTGLESVLLATGAEHRLELRLLEGRDLDGEVRDQDGMPVAGAEVLARGLVRSAWASASTAPDGSFALAGLDRVRVELEVRAPGFAPASVPVAHDAARLAVVLHPETRVALRLQDAAGVPASAADWEVAVCHTRAGRMTEPEPLEPAGDGFVAAGPAGGPFVVRRRSTEVWLRARSADGDPTLLCIPAAAGSSGPLVLSLPGTTADERADLVLVLARDGVPQSMAPADPSKALLDFGRVPVGEYRALLYSRAGLLPAVDLGVVAVGENGAPLVVPQPARGWLRYVVQRTDREPVLQCAVFAVDERGLRIPLPGAGGRVALAVGRYQLWASSLSFPTFARAFEVAAEQETVLDLDADPGQVRHVAFRLPPETDLQQCRARVRLNGDRSGDGHGFPGSDRGFDTADGRCYTTVVLAAGEYRLDVQCAGRTFHSRFTVAGEGGVAEPIEVVLDEDR